MNTLILICMILTSDKSLIVSSPAFEANDFIPSKYACTGANINPELKITGLPEHAVSLALIVEDPDAPKGVFDHWIMWDIPVNSKIGENTAPGTQGKNGKNENKYTGPCPPSGTHHYHFKVYALDTKLNLPAGCDKARLQKAMDGHILASGEVIGLFKK